MPRKYTLDESFFDVIDTEEKAFALGMIVTDGNITRKHGTITGFKIDIQSCDIDVLDCIKGALKYSGPIRRLDQYDVDGCTRKDKVRLDISSVRLARALQLLEVHPAKSMHETLPSLITRLSRPLILGILAGDGSTFFRRSGRYSRIAVVDFCGTKELLTGIQAIIPLSVPSSLYRDKRHLNIWSLRFNGRSALLLLSWLYSPMPRCYMKRKYDKYLEIKKYYEEMDKKKELARESRCG